MQGAAKWIALPFRMANSAIATLVVKRQPIAPAHVNAESTCGLSRKKARWYKARPRTQNLTEAPQGLLMVHPWRAVAHNAPFCNLCHGKRHV